MTFRYKPELDPEGVPQFGLVAEEVEKVNSDLVSSRRRRESLYRALRGGERDVAQRVPQRASNSARARPQSGGTGDYRAVEERNGSSDRATLRAGITNPEGERTARNEQSHTANSRQ
jgi:hypothetical protein